MSELLFMTRRALLSRCGTYRYILSRRWDATKPLALWVMLNPSTADAETDDPTIRKCIGFCRRWGCGGFAVVNLWAFRATRPADLKAAGWPTGGAPANDAIDHALCGADGPVVVGWGGNVRPDKVREHRIRVQWLEQRARLARRRLMCLGTTKSGQPRHPLMLAYDTELVPWEAP